MPSRYYEAEHFTAYQRIREAGLDQWNDLHQDRAGYEDFPTRQFLAPALPDPGSGRHLLEYGCGTGAAACFLARRGWRVDAVDLVPDAIRLARQHAEAAELKIDFAVADVCTWGQATLRYDVVVDSLCLQSIVTDADRSRVYAGVHERLADDGRYLISSAMYDPDRDYGTDRFDPTTGIVWTPADPAADDVVEFDGHPYQPHRRHLTPEQLRSELALHGFTVIDQAGATGGDVVARAA